MAACKECGEDHVEAAARAAIAFESVLRLMAEAEPHKRLTPTVMLHIHGLIGALLIHYSEFSTEEISGEVARVAENAEMMKGLYDNMVAVGLVEVDPKAERSEPEEPVH